jgi:cobalt-zinc-cadmium efflux system outer membrane protein
VPPPSVTDGCSASFFPIQGAHSLASKPHFSTTLMFRFSLLCTFLPLAAASASPALSVSLAEIGAKVRTSHPTLQAARLAVEEARGRQIGSGRLSNPTFGYAFQNQSKVSPQTSVFSLDQAFPLTRRLSLEKKLNTQLVAAAELEVRDMERRLIAEAQSLAIQLLSLTQQRGLLEQQSALASKLVEFVSGRAAVGEISVVDAAQVHLDAHRLLLETRKLGNSGISLLGQLKPMLGLMPEDTLTLVGDLPDLLVPNSAPAWMTRADYQLAQTKISAFQTERQLAEARRLQDLKAGLFASLEMQDVTLSNRQNTGYYGFVVSIPLPFWNRNQGEIAEKAASVARAEAESKALERQIVSEAETARLEMLANQALFRETRHSLLPLALEQAERLEKAYEQGQTSLLTILRAREQRLQLETAALEAARDFHLARIRYEAAIGKQTSNVSASKYFPSKG